MQHLENLTLKSPSLLNEKRSRKKCQIYIETTQENRLYLKTDTMLWSILTDAWESMQTGIAVIDLVNWACAEFQFPICRFLAVLSWERVIHHAC